MLNVLSRNHFLKILIKEKYIKTFKNHENTQEQRVTKTRETEKEVIS